MQRDKSPSRLCDAVTDELSFERRGGSMECADEPQDYASLALIKRRILTTSCAFRIALHLFQTGCERRGKCKESRIRLIDVWPIEGGIMAVVIWHVIVFNCARATG